MNQDSIPRRFEFNVDRFAYANQLVWKYTLNPATGGMDWKPNRPKPDYTHRCFLMARAARQFLYHARFHPDLKPREARDYRQAVRQVLARNPRFPSRTRDLIRIPGYSGLWEFSKAHETLLKDECGGAWRSYVLRSHWRMILPISRKHQRGTAARLVADLSENISPIIHLVKFPLLTINHGMIIYDSIRTLQGKEFMAYDPNNPFEPARLVYDQERLTFSLPPNSYWAGGDLNIIQIYRNWWI